MTVRSTSYVSNGEGWQLALHRFAPTVRPQPGRRPVVFVPGFAMNSFILGYHPSTTAIAGHLAQQGLEVWAAELRGQGQSQRVDGARSFCLEQMGVNDLGVQIDEILARSETGAGEVDVIGCSLGATFMFMQAAWGQDPKIARMVNLGGPLRWTQTPGLVRAFSTLGPSLRMLPIRGTRRLARHGLPLASRVPGLLHIYLHPQTTDLSEPAQLARTVDDPHPRVNAQIARWIRTQDLLLGQRNLTESVARLHQPLLTVIASADGVVPEDTVASGHNAMVGAPRQLIRCGSRERPMAHADLFIGEDAPAQVFEPIAQWLLHS